MLSQEKIQSEQIQDINGQSKQINVEIHELQNKKPIGYIQTQDHTVQIKINTNVDQGDQRIPAKNEKILSNQPASFSFFELFRFATRMDKFQMVLGTLGAIAAGIGQPLFSIFIGNLLNFVSVTVSIDEYIHQSRIAAFWLVIISLMQLFGGYLLFSCWIRSGERLTLSMRSRYFYSIILQSLNWFDDNNSNELSSKAVQQCTNIQHAIGEKIGIFIKNFVLFISGYAIAYQKGWQESLVCTVILPGIALSSFCYICLYRNMTQKNQLYYEIAGGDSEQAFSSMKTVKSLGGEDIELKKYVKNIQTAMKTKLRFSFLLGMSQGLVFFFLFACYSLSFWYGAKLINDKVYNPSTKEIYKIGDVFTVFISIIFGTQGFGLFMPQLQYFIRGKQSGTQIFKILDSVPEIERNEKGKILQNVKGSIIFQNVEFTYPKNKNVKVLKGLNLEIEGGKRTAIVGQSGSGKSTCMQLINRYYEPDKGTISLDSCNLQEYDQEWLHKNIGYMGQESVLFDTTIRENLQFCKQDATEQQMWDALKMANIKDFVESLKDKLDTKVGISGQRMSGGQKQRFCLARIFLKNPPILLLDEATSSLDKGTEQEIQKSVSKFSSGRTIIIVAHRISTIMDCDKIIVLENGQVIEQGTHSELIARKGRYFILAQKQIKDDLEQAFRQIEIFCFEQQKIHSDIKIIKQGFDQTNYLTKLFGAIQTVADNAIANHYSIKDQIINYFGEIKTQDIMNQLCSAMQSSLPSFENILYTIEQKLNNQNQQQVAEKQLKISSKQQLKAEGTGLEKSQKTSDQPQDLQFKPRVSSNDQQHTEASKYVLKRLYSYNDKFKLQFYLGTILSILNGTSYPICAMILGYMIWNLAQFNISDEQNSELKTQADKYSLYFLILAIASLFCSTCSATLFSKVSEGMIYDLRKQLYNKILKMPIYWFDKLENNPSNLQILLSDNVGKVNFLISTLCDVVINIVSCVVSAIIIAFYHTWQISLVSTGFILFQVFCGLQQKKYSQLFNNQANESYLDANLYFQQCFTNIKTTKSLGDNRILVSFLERKLLKARSLISKKANIMGILNGWLSASIFVNYAVTIFLQAYLHRDNGLPIKNIAVAIFTIVHSAIRIEGLLNFSGDFGESINSTKYIFDTLDQFDEFQIQQNKMSNQIDPKTISGEIEFRNVVFRYPERDQIVLNKVSFKIKAGLNTAIVGRSGCGKSTIIQLILRYYDIQEGEILLDNVNICCYKIDTLRKYFGVVWQDSTVFNASFKENICYNREDMSIEQLRQCALQANALEFIEGSEPTLGSTNIIQINSSFDRNIGTKGTQISGGQKQRVVIAREIAKNPLIMMLDEATSALDPECEKIVCASLAKVMKGRTQIIVTHRLTTIREADQIIVIEQGNIVEQGAYQELMSKQQYFYRLAQGNV